MNSALYVGQVRHRRYADVDHAFTYRLYMAYLDLAEIDEVFAGRWFWSTRRPAPVRYRREDFYGDDAQALDEAVRAKVESDLGFRPDGAVRLLTCLRHFGLSFNPVSFYYCFDRAENLVAIVAEITNTPWLERFAYVLDARRESRFEFDKVFHVSPFLDMDYRYRWVFTDPGASLTVHMENLRADAKAFDATLTLQRREIDGRSLAGALAQFPLMSLKVVAGIYWQALRLWWKKAPFFTHPRKRAA
ncbi:MAG: DUF1365 domain-containing protein [Planctomycetota bacterium]